MRPSGLVESGGNARRAPDDFNPCGEGSHPALRSNPPLRRSQVQPSPGRAAVRPSTSARGPYGPRAYDPTLLLSHQLRRRRSAAAPPRPRRPPTAPTLGPTVTTRARSHGAVNKPSYLARAGVSTVRATGTAKPAKRRQNRTRPDACLGPAKPYSDLREPVDSAAWPGPLNRLWLRIRLREAGALDGRSMVTAAERPLTWGFGGGCGIRTHERVRPSTGLAIPRHRPD
jgi:hypothetical protein